jgi:signal transduction histidine kinase
VSGERDGARRILASAGLATWLLVSLATVLSAYRSPRYPAWFLASLAFGSAALFATWQKRRALPARVAWLVQGAAVTAMVGLLCNGYEGALLVLVAAQLGLDAPPRTAMPWIALQTLASAVAVALHWSPRSAYLLMPGYFGFQLFVFFTMRLAAQEGAARRGLAATNAELLRLQDQLAQRTRLDERIRLAQDLHDLLGHHLTAMSLNLEAAAHQTGEESRESVRTAQSLARVLLQDVKEIVGDLNDGDEVDLRHELTRLARDVPSPRIHLEMAEGLEVGPRRSRAVLRCIQEIVTNAIRHGQAGNLWIDMRAEGGALRLTARDDGNGATSLEDGVGLSGMRRRIEELGGTLDVDRGGEGFGLRAAFPAECP